MKTIYKQFCRLEEIFCGITFTMIVTLVFVSAVARGFKAPIPWSIDVAQLLLAWTSFIAADVAFRAKKLSGLDLVTKKLPDKVQKAIHIGVLVLMLVSFIIFIIYGSKLSIDSYKRSFQTLSLSYSYVTMSLPVASVLLTITSVIQIVEALRDFNK